MKKKILILVSLFSLSFFELATADVNSFASSFYENCPADKNVCFSPYSLFSCLSKVYLGAKDDTAEEMRKAIFSEMSQEEVAQLLFIMTKAPQKNLHIADALWLAKGSSLLSSYQDSVRNLNLQIQSLDFSNQKESACEINNWVLQKTEGRIEKILSEKDLSAKTHLVLTNAIHFQGAWVKPFSQMLTSTAEFHISLLKTASVEMMKQVNHFPYYEDENCQFILLPIQGSSFCSFFLLPKTDLKDFESNFSLANLQTLVHNTSSARIALQLPKFSLHSELDGKEILKNIGLQKAFSSLADFSGITGKRSLHLDKVLHKVSFSINEKGLEASAATALVLMQSLAVRKTASPIPFIADHPFIFGLIDLDSDDLFFIGRFLNP